MWRNISLPILMVEMQIDEVFVNSSAVPKIKKHRNNVCPPISPLGRYPRWMKTYVHMKTCAQMFIAVTFRRIKRWKEPIFSSADEWKTKMGWGIYLQWNTIHPLKGLSTYACYNVINSQTMLNKRSQTQQVTYYMIPFIWIIQTR